LPIDLDHAIPSSTTTPSSSASGPVSSTLLHSQGVNTSEMSLADMASTSQRAHLCEICQKGFRSKQQLAQHSLVHTNIRKYHCAYCERAFKQLSHLQQHTRIHTGKSFACLPFFFFLYWLF
jgi:uncharacterized Zn-finger protein